MIMHDHRRNPVLTETRWEQQQAGVIVGEAVGDQSV